MPTSHAFVSSPKVEAAIRSLASNLRGYSGPCFSFRFWDGSVWASSADPASFIIKFRSERAWHRFRSPVSETALADLFVSGELDVEGNFYTALRSYRYIRDSFDGSVGASMARAARRLRTLSTYLRLLLLPGGARRDQEQETSSAMRPERPYEFYRVWLGSSMVFSSAYFQTFQEELDEAQEKGLEHICNKLQLRADDRFLDLSCNWGSLLLHVANRYATPAHGFSQSRHQIETAELRILEADLSSRCAVHFGSYRDLPRIAVPFSKIASVGISEHVGREDLSDYFRSVYKKLRAGGLFLCDFITRSASQPYETDLQFVSGTEFAYRSMPKLSYVLEQAEDEGFVVANVEELRDHYEETLRLWFRAFTRHQHELTRLADRRSLRAWEFYMASSAESLRAGHISYHQVLLRKESGGPPEKEDSRKQWQHDGDLYPLPHSLRSLDRTRWPERRWQ